MLLVFGCLVWPLSHAAVGQDRRASVSEGQAVDHRFEIAPFDGEGVGSLSSLHGRATLIVYWTPTCSSCTGVAVPEALEFATTYSDVLAVLCVGYRIASHEAMLAFAASKGWLRPGTPALWTAEVPHDLGFWKEGSDPRGDHVRLPAVLLLDEAGKVIRAGEYTALRNGGVLADVLADTAARLRRMRTDLPGDVALAWKKRRAGNAGKAIDLLAARVRQEPVEADLRSVLAQFVAYWELQARLVRADLDRGHLEEARMRFAEVSDALGDADAPALLLADLRKDVEDVLDEGEARAAQEFLALRKKLASRGPNPTLAGQLDKFATRHDGTRSALAARRLAPVAAGNPDDAVVWK